MMVIAFGWPPGFTSEEKATACQYRRKNSPPGVPGPTRQISSFCSLVSMEATSFIAEAWCGTVPTHYTPCRNPVHHQGMMYLIHHTFVASIFGGKGLGSVLGQRAPRVE